MSSELALRIAECMGAHVAQSRPLSGGCVASVYRMDLDDGRSVVVKHDGGESPRLDVEGYMLAYLAGHSALPVPAVLHHAPDLLIMAYVPGESAFSAAAEEDAARHLAALHGMQAAQHGLERPTLIGGLHQPNTPHDSWIAFFRQERLLYMAEECLRARRMSPEVCRRIERFAAGLDRLLTEPPYPSLLHGDVWTTNVLAQGGRITGFIDPAIYYGHPEIELAFITLFSTFSPAFFAAYGAIRPIAPGFFEVRRDIYNLYPLLVHTRLFGSHYLQGVDRTLRRWDY
ncbi:MAG: fructosamine kinase family protein [Candidatus Hydrogenedentes bacterium]|nr:fructosamine kinase family protein [Candidatus Hydrogenedentota bacterium]